MFSFGADKAFHLGSDHSPQDAAHHDIVALQSPACGYRNLTTWSVDNLMDDLTHVPPEKCDYMPPNINYKLFNGYDSTRWTSMHWEIPLVAIVLYLAMLATLKPWMANRAPIRLQPIVLTWNFGLSIFSFLGMIYCVPHLLFGEDAGLINRGFRASVCTHASSYGMGEVGFFVALFIYSKLAELFDTLWLVLRKSPVILLHWYHHVTVLAYCWHAYSTRIGTGLWFAAMNYTVHTVMYAYYGVTQTGPAGRKAAKKVAMIITTMQLSQMVMGITVTVASVIYHAQGVPCYVNLTNSMLGLAMYSSYFVLFLKLFLDHYVYKKSSASSTKPAASKTA